MNETDCLRRFLFEGAPVRGHWVRLSKSWLEAREHQALPGAALRLLGEALAATTLLSASLKFTGRLTLQLGGSQGPVTMLVAQVTDSRTLRGVAHLGDAPLPPDAALPDLVTGGRLVVSLEQGEGATPWQAIVPLEGATLARCLENYFHVSEQLPTAIVLAANEQHAAGLLLQKLPAPAGEGEAAGTQELWEEASVLLATLQPAELLAMEPQQLLTSLFGAHDLRLFEDEPVRFACRCDRDRVATMLRGLGREEVDSIIGEQGTVTVTCEFCHKPYRFDAVDAAALFAPAGAAESQRLN